MATAMGAPMNPQSNCWWWMLAGLVLYGCGVRESSAYPDEEPVHEGV